jgi:F-type H+-transporting ATPase subunit delta
VQQQTVARNYAEALFDIARRTGDHAVYASAFSTVVSLLDSDPRVRDFLASPKIDVEAKKAALRRALRDEAPALFVNFLMVVLEKRRQRLISEIAVEYGRLLDEHLGQLHAQITLAHAPDRAALQRITAQLSRILGRKVLADVRINRDILGGIVVRYGDRVLDGSLRRRLLSMRGRMLAASLPESV